MDKYTQEQERIEKQGKKELLKTKVIFSLLAIAITIIGLITLSKNALIGLFLIAAGDGIVLPIMTKKINSIKYTINFNIEELEKLKIQERMTNQ